MTGKRILHIYQSPSYSGAEAYARDVALWHAKRKNEVVFLAKADSPLAKKLYSDTNPFETRNFSVETELHAIHFESFDAIVLHSTREIKKIWPSLLKSRLRSLFSKTSGDTKRPRLALYSHIWISHTKRDPLHYLLYKLIDQFWGSSEASKRNLENLLPMAAEKIRVIRYGRDIDKFAIELKSKMVARDQLKIPQTAIVFGTLARVDEGKGSRELFDSALNLLKENQSLHFLMIGPPTSSDPKAIALDRELDGEIEKIGAIDPNLHSRIHKIGRLEEGSTYLSAFDLFVLATYKENFALTLLEAQLAGVPCVATDSGGSPDLVTHGQTGWLFQPQSTTSLEAAIRTALAEKAKWPEIAARAKKQVSETYRLEKVLAELDLNLGL